MASLIQTLIDANRLALFIAPDAGHLDDLSGQGNAGVATNTAWAHGAGLSFSGAAAAVLTVADAPELRLTEGTLVYFGDFHIQGVETLIYKRDAGGTNYELNLTAANVQLYDGTNTRFLATSVVGHKCLAVNMADGEVGEVFIDGLSVGVLDNASAISVDNAPLLFGNDHTGATNTSAPCRGVLIVNDRLTATEQALLYAELESLTWPQKAKATAKGAFGIELMTDGDMETAGTAAYTVGSGATLTKETGNVLGGSQVLRVAHGGTQDPYAFQVVLVPGTRYRLNGWARGDATFLPFIQDAATLIWSGTNSTTWQKLDVIFRAVGTDLRLYARANAAGYCEFDNISVTEVHEDKTQFKTDWNTKVVANLGGNNQIPNTPFWVNSGNFGVVIDTVDGKECKVIDCAASGGFQMLTSEMQGAPNLDAYGTWEFWFSKAPGSVFICHFISDDLAGTNGYRLEIGPTETVALVENGVANLFTSAAGYINADTWYKIKITRRQIDGQFCVYIDDVLVVAATGTNPVSDNTGQESTYLVFDVDTGDRICLSSKSGNNSLGKQHGVVAP